VLAALEHFDNPNLTAVKFGEYFPGTTQPADYNQDAYEDGYFTFMQEVLAGAPTDANGDRVTIYQTNPMTNADAFTATQIQNMMLGVADSNAQMFEEPATLVDLREQLHGVVPMAVGTDKPSFNDSTTYDGTANPFGYATGTTHQITVQQVAWYYGHCGPLPMDQAFIAKPVAATDGFAAAMDQFGAGGTDFSTSCNSATGDWGGIPFDH
jgi:hypothetical protein